MSHEVRGGRQGLGGRGVKPLSTRHLRIIRAPAGDNTCMQDYICRGYMQVHRLAEVLEEQSMSIGTSIGVHVESPDEISKVSQPCEACSLLSKPF